MHTIMKPPVRPCTHREPGPKRGTVRPASGCRATSGALIDASSVRRADEPVDVVPAMLPVARDDLVGHLDAGEPLHALLAVPRRDVGPYRAAVVVGDVAAEHLQGDDDVGQPSLVEG